MAYFNQTKQGGKGHSGLNSQSFTGMPLYGGRGGASSGNKRSEDLERLASAWEKFGQKTSTKQGYGGYGAVTTRRRNPYAAEYLAALKEDIAPAFSRPKFRFKPYVPQLGASRQMRRPIFGRDNMRGI